MNPTVVENINSLTGPIIIAGGENISVQTTKGSISIASSVGRKAVKPYTLGTITDGITLDQLGTGTTLEVKSGGISNAQISNTAGIVDTKLATISTAGKVSNSATTASSSNTINAIVLRDGSGATAVGSLTATALLPDTNNSRDIGATGTRWANLWLAGNATITGNVAASGTISGSNFSGSSSGVNTGDQTITLTGPVTGSGTGSFATTIGAGQVSDANLAVSYVKADGSRTLSAEWDTGATFGVKAPYFLSRSTSTAGSGTVLLSHTDTVAWRNLANSADLSLKPNASSNALNFNGVDLVDLSSTQTLSTKTLTAPTINGGTHTAVTSLGLRDTSAAFDVTVGATSSTTLTGARALTVDVANTSSTLKMAANLTVSGASTVNGTFSGSSSGTNTGDQTTISGNAATATALQTARNINGTSFNGTADITVTAAASTLTGTTLNSTVVSSSLTSVGTLANLTVTNPISGSVTGNAATVTTNANLTGPVTSSGNATAIASGAITNTMVASTLSGKTFSDAPTIQAGTSTGSALKLAGILFRSTATQQNTSTTETDLFTTTVLANTLSAAGNALIYKSNGSLSNNAATKTLKLYFGSTSVTLFAVTTANTTWRIEVEVSRISSGSQRVTGIVYVGTTINQILDQTFSVTDSSDQTAKLTGTGTIGSGDFNAKFFSLGFERS